MVGPSANVTLHGKETKSLKTQISLEIITMNSDRCPTAPHSNKKYKNAKPLPKKPLAISV